jgi:hypothetical protein
MRSSGPTMRHTHLEASQKDLYDYSSTTESRCRLGRKGPQITADSNLRQDCE